MRISTSQIFDIGSARITDLQSSLAKTQQQISSNKRVLTPADDPVAAASALGVTQAMSMNDQFATNRNNAKSALGQEESVMASVTTLLQNVKSLVVGAGNGSLDDTQRKDIATQLQSNLDQLMGAANTRNSEGDYIFAGYQTGAAPFTKTATGIVYSGDQGQRMLQVSPSRQLAVSDPGSAIFEGPMTGNGQFVTAAGAANTGSGVINAGSVIDPTQMNGQSYSLTFSVDAAGNTTYLVTETPPPATPATPQPYVDGQNITVGGAQFAITGKPANGDTFSVDPSANQSMFTTLSNLISALSTSAVGSTNQTRLANALNTANNNIDNALSTVSTTRATIGSRLSEIDDLDSAGSDLGLQYTQQYKDLIEIDPAAAYSSFLQQSYTLDAARQTFQKIAGMSLFNFLQ